MRKNIWMQVTRDELELPVIIADNAEELARKVGVRATTIISSVKRYEEGKYKTCRYRKVELDEEET